MTQQTSPFTETKYGWNFGESGWNTGMDENLVKFSFLFDRNINGIVNTLPSAVTGTAYFLTTDNRVYFSINNSWMSSPVPKWFIFTLRTTGATYQFNGTALQLIPNNSDLNTNISAIQATISSLGTAAYRPETYFATTSQLDVASAQANSYTDTAVNVLNDKFVNNTDITKGLSTVGFRRSANSLPGYAADQLRGQQVQLFEYIPASQRAAIIAGTSVYDATAAAQAWLDDCNAMGAIAVHDFGTVLVNFLEIKAGAKALIGNGTIKTNDLTTTAALGVLIVRGSFYGGGFTGVDGFHMSGITIDAGGGAKRGFFGSSVTNSLFDSIKVKGLNLTSTSSALRFTYDCNDNIIANNTCTLPTVTDPNTQTCYGIHIVANDQAFSGWGTGNIIPATNKCMRNQIVDNKVTGGTHGISITGSDENIIALNYLFNNAHRNIHITHSSENEVIGNQCREAGSSAIIMGYGSNNNNIIGNFCYSNQPSGESAIEAYVASTGNNIEANRIRSGANYGIYLAIDSSTNSIIGNRIDCSVLKKAGIAVESDWMASPPGGTLPYSRPNYGAPPSPRVNWPNGASSANIIKGNWLYSGNANIAAIYISQVGSVASNILQVVSNNSIWSGFAFNYYYAEITSGLLAQQVITGNDSDYQDVTKAFATRGRAHFNSVKNNDTFNGDNYYTPAANTAVPSAFFSDKITLAGYTAATNVTNFSGGGVGQKLEVLLGTNSTLVHNASLINLKGAVNVAGVANGKIRFENRAGIWFEESRSF